MANNLRTVRGITLAQQKQATTVAPAKVLATTDGWTISSTATSSSNSYTPVPAEIIKCYPAAQEILDELQFMNQKIRGTQAETLDYLLLPSTLDRVKRLSTMIKKVKLDAVKCASGNNYACPPTNLIKMIDQQMPLDKVSAIMKMYRPVINDTLGWFADLVSQYSADCPTSKLDKVMSIYSDLAGMLQVPAASTKIEGFRGNLTSMYDGDSCYGAPTITIPAWTLQASSVVMIAMGLFLLYRMRNN